MELSKVVLSLVLCLTLAFESGLFATLEKESGQILFLIHQGNHKQALDIYKNQVSEEGQHNYELLHRMGLAFLNQGFRQKDPEIKLMTLFGASISAHDEAYYILEESLQSPYPQLQLVALGTLAKAHSDRADRALLKAMAAGHPLIRLEAASQLCLKKHPQAVLQTESLMYKLPTELAYIFPQLFACVGNIDATSILKRLLNDSSEKVRINTIASIVKNKRDDFLPQIRQLASQHSFAQQEMVAMALGRFHDEKSRPKLERMSRSQYPCVRLAAWNALDLLGDPEAASQIQNAGRDEDLFAIQLLSQREGNEELLAELMKSPKLQVRVNATLGLLQREDARCIAGLAEILIHDKRDLGFSKVTSPGETIEIWKATPSASQIFNEESELSSLSLHLKEEVIQKARRLPEIHFLELAEKILLSRQSELISEVVSQLAEIKTEGCIELLKKYQQQPGAPLLRQYCNLALYELNEEGPYGSNIREWIKNQKNENLIQFRAALPWSKETLETPYTLTPEQTSKLLITSFEVLSNHQDKEGLEILLDAIQNGNAKNKYALAGLLVRATQ